MGVGEFYERTYQEDRPNLPKPSLYSRIMERLLGRFILDRYKLTYQAIPEGESILDIGCGGDLTIMPLWEKYKTVYGIDISKTIIERTQKEFGDKPGIHLAVGDINEYINLPGESFDTIIAVAVMEHIFDPYHLMKECHRMLKTEGLLIVAVPNIAWLGNRVRLLLGILPVTSTGEGWDGGHLHYFTRGSLKKLFQQEGFNVSKILWGGPSRKFWGSLLSQDILVAGKKIK